MMVVGWNLLAHSNQTFTLLINVDLLFATSSPFLMTILLTQKEASIIPDILWYMLILFDNFTMDEDISRACSAGPNFKSLFCCSKLQQTYDGSHTLPVFSTKCTSLALPSKHSSLAVATLVAPLL